ncbi:MULTISPECIES: DNA/RNA non-specific endonuclease [Vibrio]|uniref:DNA/RNA non-specific endonuclease n=1 Tax=Vibrio TaxID=662 RepID=UPI001E3F30A5|nr:MULTISPECIES: DNA/RNA non-specific endonuclease [Vibrio]MCC2524978.1 DNA/RNA non-specific endonuclease [Vibrio coralliilyticus]USD35523.1 DNA/RNA non-specific endonuclease [Vibrio sp. SCSIO 43186]USD72647.1 DNA/RNA non-specific endonuclease [Vibrio sp. SCSIO 43139]USD98858.1 DNA/RNA endonuclease [Vibrio coralliilyticus]
MKGVLTSALLALAISSTAHAELVHVKYKLFSVTLDCSTKSAVSWSYSPKPDSNNFKRHDSFYFDPNVPTRCQQTSQGTYKSHGEVKYDRGHLVPANAMDSDELAITQSNSMVNVLPMAAQMNRGAWYQTELYVECRRDIAPVSVYGGVWAGESPQDGNFMISHGIMAPQAFWKVVVTENNVISWWIPNSPEATKSNIDLYITSVSEIEERAGVSIQIPEYMKTLKAASTNAMLSGCNYS